MNAVNKVYRTTNYSLFKRLEGNRDISLVRVNKIIKSIKKVGYVQSPIIVNENHEIIDGQARRSALESLGLPVDYIVVMGVGIDECIAMNINQSNWGMLDFVESYAELGNESYIYLLNLMKEYLSDIKMQAIVSSLTGLFAINKEQIKSGDFKTTMQEYNKARKILDYVRRFVPIISRLEGRTEQMYLALVFCFRLKDIDKDRLYKKMYSRQAELFPVANMEQALTLIESIYNHMNREKVYIVTEYKKELAKRKRAS